MTEDELYGLPLGDFTAARDALSAKLKAAGDKAGAAAAKKLVKPSVPAWAANQIVRWGRREFERLQAAARELREQQATGAPAQALRDGLREQNQALQACEQRASQLLADAGHAATPAVLQRVSHTLLALAHGAPDVKPGSLTSDLQPPGFEALPTLAPAPPRTPAAAPVEAPAASEVEGDAAARERLERERAERERAELEARRKRLDQSLQAARESLSAAESRLEAHESDAADAERRLKTARERAEQARGEVAQARARLTAAQDALAQLS